MGSGPGSPVQLAQAYTPWFTIIASCITLCCLPHVAALPPLAPRSIWYVHLGRHTDAAFQACQGRLAGGGGGGGAWDVSLARSVEGLKQSKAVPVAKRLNPKQRQRLKRKMGERGG